jgi:hypothetical protein
MQTHPGIRIDRIPAEEGGGFIFALGMVGVVLVAMPGFWPVALGCLAGGALLAPVLHRFYY